MQTSPAVELAGDDGDQFPQVLPPEAERLTHHPRLLVVHLDEVSPAHGVVQQVAVVEAAAQRQVQEHLAEAGSLPYAAEGRPRRTAALLQGAKDQQVEGRGVDLGNQVG